MIIIGLTGSIGMGKSTAAKMLKKMGGAVHDADASVKQALNPYGKGFESVALAFPQAWDKKKHLIKKDVLADIIFNDDKAKKRLESLLHPIVKEEEHQFIKEQKLLGRKFCVLDIPLLYETGADERVDKVIVVTAPDFIQKQRVLSRPNMTRQKFERIKASQMSDEIKTALADFTVQTGLGKAYTFYQLKKIIRKIT